MADAGDAGTRRMLRIDLVVAVVALLVSAIAALGTWYQTNVVAEQLSSTVWPYVNVSTSADDSGRVAMTLTNDGTGPAIIRGITIDVDGKPYQSLADVVRAIGFRGVRGGHARIDRGSVDYGTAIRAGASVTFLTVVDRGVLAHFVSHPKSLRIRACYCSILDRCWIHDDGPDPKPVANCDAFHQASLVTGGNV